MKSKKHLHEMRKRQTSRGKTGGIGKWGVDQFIKDNTRQVRWLYHASNKCTQVVSEKEVRVLVAHYESLLEEAWNDGADSMHKWETGQGKSTFEEWKATLNQI